MYYYYVELGTFGPEGENHCVGEKISDHFYSRIRLYLPVSHSFKNLGR